MRSPPSGGQRGQEQRGRRLEGEPHGVVVDLLDQGRRAVSIAHPARERRRQVLVEQHVLVPEHDVVGGHRRAVGPLAPLRSLTVQVLKSAEARRPARSWARSCAPSGEKRNRRRRPRGHSCWRRPGRGRRGARRRHTGRRPHDPDHQRLFGQARFDGGSLPALTCSASAGASLNLSGRWGRRLGRLDFGRLRFSRLVSRLDLGGFLLLPGLASPGPGWVARRRHPRAWRQSRGRQTNDTGCVSSQRSLM